MPLTIIATPIGNLQDLSPRAAEALRTAELLVCEDTRVTAKLLAHLGVRVPMLAVHHHADNRIAKVVTAVAEGKRVALVTDAGTPGISDPGGKVIEAVVRELGEEAVISPIPGPNAAIAALSVSGFPCDHFVFLGFPPHKNGRQTYFRDAVARSETVVFYESPHRIEKTLETLVALAPDRSMVLARELTKKFESIYRGTPAQVTVALSRDTLKGEFVVVLAPL